jgi:transketolase
MLNMYENTEMRVVFGAELGKLMHSDERIVVVDADLSRSNGTFPLRAQFPERTFNVGVAEANMVCIAAGMASYGMVPFVTTFACFASRRVCDQIAISVAYARRNVKITGTDPGIAAEMNGGTHMSMEDIGVLRSISGLVIFEPADAVQLAQSLPRIVAYEGPVYIRLFRKVTPAVFADDYKFDLFRADVLREGADVSLFATGIMLKPALEAAEKLAATGISAEVVNVHTIKPIDAETIIASVSRTGAAVTCENHNIIGGLRSAVAEVLAESCPAPLKAVGIRDQFGVVGKLPYLLKRFRLTADDIVEQALAAIAAKHQTGQRRAFRAEAL